MNHAQALVVAGGYRLSAGPGLGWQGQGWQDQGLDRSRGYASTEYLSSVLMLLPGAKTWVSLASLPHPLIDVRASIVGGRLRIVGGQEENFGVEGSTINEVIMIFTSESAVVHIGCEVCSFFVPGA